MSIRCPKCNSDQITAHKKGFSGRKAVAGAVLTGGIGILAGTLGSNKVKITCLSCSHTFGPGEGRSTPRISSSTTVDPSAINTTAGSWSRDVEALRNKGEWKAPEVSKKQQDEFWMWIVLLIIGFFVFMMCS